MYLQMTSLKPSQTVRKLSPLAALVLTACGGGSSGSTSVGGGLIGPANVKGNVVKGPLSNALVFLDYDNDGILDSGEPSVRTAADGSFALSTSNTNYSIVAVTDDSTIDISSGSVLSGVTLTAPSTASVVTPSTTLMEQGNLTADQVAKVLGLPEGIDPLTFNPYAPGVNPVDALAMEKASQQVMSVVNAFSASAEGAGASQADAFNAALKAVVEVVKSKAEKLNDVTASAADKTLDLTHTADLLLIKTQVTTEVATVAGVNQTAFTAMANDTTTAVGNINNKIATVTDLNSDISKNIFSTAQVLSDQAKTAAEAEVANAGSGNIYFTSSAAVNTSATNKTPTDVNLSKTSISESSSSLVMGTLSTTDTDQTAGAAFTYTLATLEGTDHTAFSINQATGELSFLSRPHYETKNTYSVTILSTDEGGKSYSKAFVLSVTNTNNAPTVTSNQVTTVNEDVAYSYTFAANDVDAGDSLTYAATTKPDWLNFNTSTGVLSGTPTNAHVGNHAVVLNATDAAGAVVTQSFTVTVANVNDAPTLSVSNGSVTEDSGTYTSNGTLIGADVDVGTTLTYGVASNTGTYGGISLNTSSGVYTYTMDNTNATVQALNGSETLTESFSVSVTDGITTTVNTLSFVIHGTNDGPTGLALSANAIAENAMGGSVGTLSASDIDGDTLTYSLATGGDNDSFEINGTRLKLKDSVAANYEANNVYDLTISASDGVASTSLTQAVIVTNVSEANTSYYTGKADTSASANLNPQNDAAVENLMSGYFWGSAGSGIDLTYSFMDTNSLFGSDYNSSGRTTNRDNIQDPVAAFKLTVSDILDLYSNVSLLNFTEVAETGDVVGHLRFGTTQAENSAFAWYPYGNSWDPSGDIWVNHTSNYYHNSYALMDGTYWNHAIIHEVGHSLGLAHTQSAASYGGTTYGTDSYYGTVHNASPYSVMAYPEYIGEGSDSAENTFSRSTNLMLDDIAALQYLYGTNEQHNATDTVYTINSFHKGTYSDAYYGRDYVYASIWDAGGTDTFSWAGETSIASINLNAGSFSSFGNITGPDDTDLDNQYMLDGDGILGIAYDAIIENAIGGSNIDTLVGNEVGNTLYGGAGTGVKDTLTGNGGADIFVSCMADANTDFSVADIIADFTNGTDFIGLEDWSLSDLSWSNISGGTQIAHKTNNNIMFFLDGVDAGLIDETDFIATDFV
jgi:VCBS repeat-containing protein